MIETYIQARSKQIMKSVLMKFMLMRDILRRDMLTGRNQDLHVFIGMLLFLIVAYFVGV